MQNTAELPDIKFPTKNCENGIYKNTNGAIIGTLGLFDQNNKCNTRGDNNCFAYAFATSMFLKIATLSDKSRAISFSEKFREKFPQEFTLDFGKKISEQEISRADTNYTVLKKEFNTVLDKFQIYLQCKPTQAALYIHQQMMQNQKFSLAIAAMVKQITLDELKKNSKNEDGLRYFDILKSQFNDTEKDKYKNLYEYIQDYKVVGKLDTLGEMHHIFRKKMDFLDYNVNSTVVRDDYKNPKNLQNKLIFSIDHSPEHFSAALPLQSNIEDSTVKLPKVNEPDIFDASEPVFKWQSEEIKFNNTNLELLTFEKNEKNIIEMENAVDKVRSTVDPSDYDELIKLLGYAGRDVDIKNLQSSSKQQQAAIKRDLRFIKNEKFSIVSYINEVCYPNNIIDNLPDEIKIGNQTIGVSHEEQNLVNKKPMEIALPAAVQAHDEIVLTFQADHSIGALDKAAAFLSEYDKYKENNDLQFVYCEAENMFYCLIKEKFIHIKPEIAVSIIGDYLQLEDDKEKKEYANDIETKIAIADSTSCYNLNSP